MLVLALLVAGIGAALEASAGDDRELLRSQVGGTMVAAGLTVMFFLIPAAFILAARSGSRTVRPSTLDDVGPQACPRSDSTELVQFGDLDEDSFAAHPAWVSCHVLDYDEPWYDDTDEETFRPWEGALPVDPALTMFVVSATFRFADGTSYRGLVTPIGPQDDGAGALGVMQPWLFLPDAKPVAFWPVQEPAASRERERLLRATGKSQEEVFPIRFEADRGLAGGIASGEIPG
jgi:hypothetical protein